MTTILLLLAIGLLLETLAHHAPGKAVVFMHIAAAVCAGVAIVLLLGAGAGK